MTARNRTREPLRRGGVMPVAHEDYDDWIVCWQCGGEGELEDCFEDTCVCTNPPCLWKPCDICKGDGGWSNG